MKLHDLIAQKLAQDPNRLCMEFEDHSLTRGQFASLCDAATEALKKAGFGKGMRLLTLLPNCPNLLALAMGAWRLGGALVPLTTALGDQLLGGAIQLVDPFAVVTTEEGAALPLLQQLCADKLNAVSPLAPITDLKGSAACRIDSQEFALLFATSGTTGLPKAVPLTHENIIDNIRGTAEHVYLKEDDDLKALNVLPNHHTFGFCVSGLLPLVLGYAQRMLPHFLPPKRVLDALYGGGVSVLIAVPTLYGMLAEGILKAGLPHPPHLKHVICGGSATPQRIYDRTKQALGVDLHEGYGLTECSPIVASVRLASDGCAGKIGPFLKSFEHQLRDLEGKPIEGNEGVLWVKGPSVCHGYYLSSEVDNSRFDGPWFNTGDVVRLNEDGTMSILDRTNDLIIVSGFNVYPQEVENKMSAHPAIAECVAVGAKNPLSGEVVVLYVVKAEGAEVSEKELLTYAKENLANYKAPRAIRFVDELPRNAMGKPLRRVIRDMERSRG